MTKLQRPVHDLMKDAFAPEASLDAMVKLHEAVLARAGEALGDVEKGARWIASHNRALGARPSELLDSGQGVWAVLRVLGRIEHGVHS